MIPVAFESETSEELGEPAHRHLAVVLEQPQDVHLAHAHVALDEPAHRGAAQLADPAADFCQDGFDVGGPRRGGGAAGGSVADTSHDVKHSTDMNDFVNVNVSADADVEEAPMRFALMIEAQQGLSYEDQLAIARRAEAAGFEAFFRSDHYASFPGRADQADDRRLGRPRRPRPRDVDDPPRRARQPGDVPPPGQLREARHDGRPDERRADRGRRRRGLERRRPPAARPRRSRRSSERADLWRTSSRCCTACGRSRPAGRSTATRSACATARCGPGPVEVDGPAVGENGRDAAADHHRQRGHASWLPDRRALRGRVQPLVVLARRRAGEAGRARRGLRAVGPRPEDAHALGDGRGAHRARRGRGRRAAPTRCSPSSARSAGAARAWLDARRERWILGHAGRGARDGRAATPRPGSSGSCSRTSCPATSTIIDLMAEELIGKV